MKGKGGSISIGGIYSHGSLYISPEGISINGVQIISPPGPGQTLVVGDIVARGGVVRIGAPGYAAATAQAASPGYLIEGKTLIVESYRTCTIGGDFDKVIVQGHAIYNGSCASKEVVVEASGKYINDNHGNVVKVTVEDYGSVEKSHGSIVTLTLGFKATYTGFASITDLVVGKSATCETYGQVTNARIEDYGRYTDKSDGISDLVTVGFKGQVTKEHGSIKEVALKTSAKYKDLTGSNVDKITVGDYGSVEKSSGSIGTLTLGFKATYTGFASITDLVVGKSATCETSGQVTNARIEDYGQYTDYSDGTSNLVTVGFKGWVTKVRGSISQLIRDPSSIIKLTNIGPQTQDREAIESQQAIAQVAAFEKAEAAKKAQPASSVAQNTPAAAVAVEVKSPIRLEFENPDLMASQYLNFDGFQDTIGAVPDWEEFKALLSAFIDKRAPTIQRESEALRLNLSNNNLGDKLAGEILSIVINKDRNVIQELKLNGNGITSAGAKDIANRLTGCVANTNSLIELQDNLIGDDGVEPLLRAFLDFNTKGDGSCIRLEGNWFTPKSLSFFSSIHNLDNIFHRGEDYLPWLDYGDDEEIDCKKDMQYDIEQLLKSQKGFNPESLKECTFLNTEGSDDVAVAADDAPPAAAAAPQAPKTREQELSDLISRVKNPKPDEDFSDVSNLTQEEFRSIESRINVQGPLQDAALDQLAGAIVYNSDYVH